MITARRRYTLEHSLWRLIERYSSAHHLRRSNSLPAPPRAGLRPGTGSGLDEIERALPHVSDDDRRLSSSSLERYRCVAGHRWDHRSSRPAQRLGRHPRFLQDRVTQHVRIGRDPWRCANAIRRCSCDVCLRTGDTQPAGSRRRDGSDSGASRCPDDHRGYQVIRAPTSSRR